ncbi:response regulator [Candidatus Poribacteria bacterium]|nr:response regulator [Candidatus Poribacteria bacterium]
MKKTILIVEDDLDIQEYYKIVLSDCGLDLNILQSFNGKEALDKIDSNKNIDLIILDLIMPVMDGEEFLKKLRNEKKSSIPVIVATVNDYSINKIASENDIQGFFYKMKEKEELIDLIKKAGKF